MVADKRVNPIWIELLNEILPKYKIDTPDRVNMFLAQAAHESAGFYRLTENLNYSAEGLAATWPSRYRGPNRLAFNIARNPRLIANHTYANRMGNGNVESEDGWRYRGRGIFQLTGRNNYAAFFEHIDEYLNPELLTEPEYAIRSACWFWDINKLNNYADVHDIFGCTKVINGGLNGIIDRETKYNALRKVR